MDIGALFCRPRSPRCDGCPLVGVCRFRAGVGVVGWAMPRATTEGRPAPRFEATTRWLRGRILDGARAATHDGWFDASGPIGAHGSDAADAAVGAMAAEGLLERHPGRPGLVRLPR
jgi:A/G-specific adenine glycosylase